MASTNTDPFGTADELTGRVLLDRYRLEHPIASGGMATVWEGTDLLLSRRVAVKILHRHLAHDEAFRRRFQAEAIAAARLTHPGIVAVYDTVRDGPLDAIVMELVRGITLRVELDRHGALQLHAVLAIGIQVADALGSAHRAGLVHRDVKPANILLSTDGRVLVADFGIAKAAHGADLTEAGTMIGTAKYLSPEQAGGGPIDARSDLYSLGLVLYEALTGRPAFHEDTDVATALARLRRDPIPIRSLRPDVPPTVEAVIARAMARNPAERFPDATALRRALLDAGAEPDRAATVARRMATEAPIAAPPTPAPRRGRNRAVAILIALVLLGATATAWRIGPWSSGLRTLPITGAIDVDPAGDGENPQLLPHLTDDDPDTAWRTEGYRSGPVLAKGGVGVALTLDDEHTISEVVLDTPAGGWDATVFVSDDDRAPTSIGDWGEPAGSVTDAPTGRFVVRLDDTVGQHVLVWFTRLTPISEDAHGAVLRHAEIRGR